MKRIDTTPVHIYVATKVAVARTGDDPQVAEAREALLGFIAAAARTSDGSDKRDEGLSLEQAVQLGKAIWKLKGTGAEISRGGGEDRLEQVLPSILQSIGAPPRIAEALGPETEHAVLFLALSILKAHEKSPVPIPVEIVLYEAWNTHPAEVSVRGAEAPLYSLKAWTYGMNGFCDLAAKEAGSAESVVFDGEAAREGIALFTGKTSGVSQEDLEKVDNGIRAVGHGGVAICHLEKGDDRGARPHMQSFIQRAEKAGLPGQELEALKALVDCGGSDDEVAAGLARIDAIEAGGGVTEDTRLLRAYCEASEETSFELARKLSLGGKLVDLGLGAAKRSGLDEELKDSPAIRAASGFALACEKAGAQTSGISDAVGGLKDSARGLLDRSGD